MDSQDSAIRPSALLDAAKRCKRRATQSEMNLRIRIYRMRVALTGKVEFLTPHDISPENIAKLEAWERDNPSEAADVASLAKKKEK